MADLKVYHTTDEIAWCPGCGNHVILACLKQALLELEKQPHEVLLCSGIGQAAKTPHYIRVNGFNGLHGRALPPAVAAKIVNPNLTVIVNTGDGDSYGEGGNHFLHNIRRNVDITHFVHDNRVYGLTKGQASPTSELGRKTGVQTEGAISQPLNPLALAISQDAGFVARGFTGEREHLIQLMKAAIEHSGYALVDILQPCVIFNKINTLQWYKEKVYLLPEDYDSTDQVNAFAKSLEWDQAIPLGIIYRHPKPSFMERINHLPAGRALVDKELNPKDAEKYLEDFF
jgi:2-oxoglutarate ferredoxin oxidoreductase subunit beta